MRLVAFTTTADCYKRTQFLSFERIRSRPITQPKQTIQGCNFYRRNKMVPFLPCVSSFWHYKRPPPPCRTWQVVSSIKKPLQLNYSSSTKVPQKMGLIARSGGFSFQSMEMKFLYLMILTLNMFFSGGYRMMDS